MCAKLQWLVGNKNKIHWRSWKRTCLEKVLGKMSSQDLEVFNKALLAKQCWQLLQNPTCLLRRVSRGRYYRIRSFLQASLRLNPSYAWRSTLQGCELFRQGFRWRVGNGHSVSIWNDPQIHGLGRGRPLQVHESLKGRVSDFHVSPRGMD